MEIQLLSELVERIPNFKQWQKMFAQVHSGEASFRIFGCQ